MTVELSSGSAHDPADRIRTRRRVAAVAAVWLLAAVAGALVGQSGPDDADNPRPARVASGQLSLAYRAPWSRATTRRPVPGLHLDRPLTLRSTDDGLEIVAGTERVADPRLLPAAFLRAVRRPLVQARVQFGSAQGLRYTRLRQKGSDVEFSLAVVPTQSAAAFIVCHRSGQSIDASDQTACDAIGRTIKLKAGARPLAPTASYASHLQQALTSLQTVRRIGLDRLAAAASLSEQTAALGELSRKCRTRAQAVHHVASGPQEQALQLRLAGAVDKLCAAFSTMASAAEHDDRSRYAEAAKQSTIRAQSVTSAVRAFSAAGYQLR
jgi:hypothetical protein